MYRCILALQSKYIYVYMYTCMCVYIYISLVKTILYRVNELLHILFLKVWRVLIDFTGYNVLELLRKKSQQIKGDVFPSCCLKTKNTEHSSGKQKKQTRKKKGKKEQQPEFSK